MADGGGAGNMGSLYSEFQCIMDNGHMGPLPRWAERQTDTNE